MSSESSDCEVSVPIWQSVKSIQEDNKAHLTQLAALRAEVESLKCCGNCIYLDCCVDRSLQSEDRLLASRICKDWQSDNLTVEQRRK